MNGPNGACPDPIPLETLVAYHLGDLGAAEETRVESHFFGCAECAARLEWVERLGIGVRDLVRAGGVTASVTEAVLARGRAEGIRIRRYELAPGQQVACTAAPDDDFVAIALKMEIDPSESIDLDVETTFLHTGERSARHFEQLTVDRAERELVFLFSGDAIRSIPRSAWSMEAIARKDGNERRLGPYRLDHTPWDELPSG